MNDVIDLQPDEARAWTDAVARFTHEAIAPLFARPERIASPQDCRRALDGLLELGVLNTGPDAGLGLWDLPASALGRRLSLAYLQVVAQSSAALAYQMHLQAMARYLDRLAGVHDAQGLPLVLLQGHQGLGREAVVHHINGAVLPPDQAAMLADNWCWPDAMHPRLLNALPDWTALWLCTWRDGAGWGWHRVDRQALSGTPMAPGFGLDELPIEAVHALTDASVATASLSGSLSGEAAASAWSTLQAVHAMGLLAITQAGVHRAGALAYEQAHLRQQGGQLIARHAAVQQLISLACSTASEAVRDLQIMTQPDAPWPALRELWRMRARHQVRLSMGASAALQVFGGMGYMKDTGMEKLLRQTHHLRLLGGSPFELAMCVACWDTLCSPWPDAMQEEPRP
ncbi:MAG: acyl-CoA dehydrogenase family protein [Pseudomonadota bacterium]